MSNTKKQDAWVNWNTTQRGSRDEDVLIGGIRLSAIRNDCARFDLRNESGDILMNCLVRPRYESGESGGSPSYPTTWLTLEAVMPGGWVVKLDGTVQLRRVPASVEREKELNEIDSRAAIQREQDDLQRRQWQLERELSEVNGKLGKPASE